MLPASLPLERWPSIAGHLSSLTDLDASARRHGALRREHGARGAADLLHLAGSTALVACRCDVPPAMQH